MKRDSFVFYSSDYRSIKDMSDEQLGRFFRAICEYALNGIEKIEDKELKYAFKLLIDKIKRDQAKYDEKCKKRSDVAKEAWSKRLHAIAADSVCDNESENVCDSDIINIKKFFLFRRRICPVNCEFERFWCHYAKNDWVDGNGVKITNKIACAKNWQIPDSVQTLLSYQAVAWHKIYSKLSREPNCDILITDLVKIEVKNVTLTITCTSAMRDFLEKHIENVKDIVHSDFKCQYLEYAP